MARRKESETVQVGARMKEPLRAALEESARERGLSLNSEIIRRLEWSFDEDRRLELVFGGPEVFDLLRAIAAVMHDAGNLALWRSGRDVRDRWRTDAYAYDLALRAAVQLLEASRPAGEIKQPEPARQPAAPWQSLIEGDPETVARRLRAVAAAVEHEKQGDKT